MTTNQNENQNHSSLAVLQDAIQGGISSVGLMDTAGHAFFADVANRVMSGGDDADSALMDVGLLFNTFASAKDSSDRNVKAIMKPIKDILSCVQWVMGLDVTTGGLGIGRHPRVKDWTAVSAWSMDNPPTLVQVRAVIGSDTNIPSGFFGTQEWSERVTACRPVTDTITSFKPKLNPHERAIIQCAKARDEIADKAIATLLMALDKPLSDGNSTVRFNPASAVSMDSLLGKDETPADTGENADINAATVPDTDAPTIKPADSPEESDSESKPAAKTRRKA